MTYEGLQHPHQIRNLGSRVRSQNFVVCQFSTDCIIAKSKEREVRVVSAVALVVTVRIALLDSLKLLSPRPFASNPSSSLSLIFSRVVVISSPS